MQYDVAVLKDLRERVRWSGRPSRKLDAELFTFSNVVDDTTYVYGPRHGERVLTFQRPLFSRWRAPDYTASLDAALALVERVLPGWQAILYTEIGMAELYDATRKPRRGIKARAERPTLALAVLDVLLSALIAQSEAEG